MAFLLRTNVFPSVSHLTPQFYTLPFNTAHFPLLLPQDELQLSDMQAVLQQLAGSWQGLEAAVSQSGSAAQQQSVSLLQQVSGQCAQLGGRVRQQLAWDTSFAWSQLLTVTVRKAAAALECSGQSKHL
jgi:hypothetical protein